MPFVPAQCPNCGSNLTVDNTKDCAICSACGTPFIIEKAINNYISNYNIVNNNSIHADVVNITDNIVEQALSNASLYIKSEEYIKARETLNKATQKMPTDYRLWEMIVVVETQLLDNGNVSLTVEEDDSVTDGHSKIIIVNLLEAYKKITILCNDKDIIFKNSLYILNHAKCIFSKCSVDVYEKYKDIIEKIVCCEEIKPQIEDLYKNHQLNDIVYGLLNNNLAIYYQGLIDLSIESKKYQEGHACYITNLLKNDQSINNNIHTNYINGYFTYKPLNHQCDNTILPIMFNTIKQYCSTYYLFKPNYGTPNGVNVFELNNKMYTYSYHVSEEYESNPSYYSSTTLKSIKGYVDIGRAKLHFLINDKYRVSVCGYDYHSTLLSNQECLEFLNMFKSHMSDFSFNKRKTFSGKNISLSKEEFISLITPKK